MTALVRLSYQCLDSVATHRGETRVTRKRPRPDGIAPDRDGALVGFALFRRIGRELAIGPVVAPADDDPVCAKALISDWIVLNADMFVRIDATADSPNGWKNSARPSLQDGAGRPWKASKTRSSDNTASSTWPSADPS